MVPFGAMTVAVVSGHYGLSIWLGVAVALSFGVIVGLVNGILVNKTAVPSLIVTLAACSPCRASCWPDRPHHQIHLGRTDVEGPAKVLFGDFILGGQLQVMVLWWLALTALYIFFVHVSPFGNWIFAMGATRPAPAMPASRLTG